MSVPLRVLGDRVLVKPDMNLNAPEQTEAGVYLARSLAAAVSGEDPSSSLHRGTVIAVGRPAHPLQHEAVTLADKLERYVANQYDGDHVCVDAVALLRDLVRRQPCVSPGEDVLFSHDAGQDAVVDGEAYIILREDELLAVIHPEPVGVV